jgi:hypothetical protein
MRPQPTPPGAMHRLAPAVEATLTENRQAFLDGGYEGVFTQAPSPGHEQHRACWWVGAAWGCHASGHVRSLASVQCDPFVDQHQPFFGDRCAACQSVVTWQVPGFRYLLPRSRDCAECPQLFDDALPEPGPTPNAAVGRNRRALLALPYNGPLEQHRRHRLF